MPIQYVGLNLLNEKDRKKLFDQNLEKLKATHER